MFGEPGPFLAFTHGDPAPTNNHVAGDEVRLLDFEYGGFRHALYDITAWSRALAMFFNSSIYAFTVMLSTVLLGIAVGSWAINPFMRRRWNWRIDIRRIEFRTAARHARLLRSFRLFRNRHSAQSSLQCKSIQK